MPSNEEKDSWLWNECGFSAQEEKEWLQAQCDNPAVARSLVEIGLTPESASRIASGLAKSMNYTSTQAYEMLEATLIGDKKYT